jgi:hypothetical protein
MRFISALGAGGILFAGSLMLAGCLSDYSESYKLKKEEPYKPLAKESSLGECKDRTDNDGDQLIDCDDPGCSIHQECQVVNNADNAENTLVKCSDAIDNDTNGQIDCEDTRCKSFQKCNPAVLVENSPQLCSDKVDNNANGQIDCADAQCQTLLLCKPGDSPVENTVALCTDKADNNGNGKIDCADPDCAAMSACLPPVENTPSLCKDGKDNDLDAITDCKDSDCENFTVCNPAENTTLLCKDGADNDGDGAIDCKDTNCKDLFACSVPDQDTIFIMGYKTTGKMTPSVDATKPPLNLTWYFNGGGVPATDPLGAKGILAGFSEETNQCNVEPVCRKLTFSPSWGIAFLIFFDNAGVQDTINLSSYIGSSLKFSIKSQVPDLRIKLESKHLSDAVEIRLTDVGYDPTKTTWQNIVVPLLVWTSSLKLEYNRLPFSLAKPEGSAGGVVTLENLRIEKQGI